MSDFWNNKTILLTGGAGSLGTELVDQLLKFPVHAIRIFDVSEASLYASLQRFGHNEKLRYHQGDIRDRERLRLELHGVDYVLHLAALKSVDLAALNPVETIETNAIGTIAVVEESLHTNVKRVLCLSCYDASTRVLTTTGFKTYGEIKKGDMVFTLSMTGAIEEKPVEEVVINDYSGPMVHFKGQSTDLLVTPEHKLLVWTKSRTHGQRLFYETAENLLRREQFRLPVSHWLGIKHDLLPLPRPTPPRWHNKNIINSPSKIKTNDLLYLMGIFIGDGSFNDKGGKKPNYGGVFFDTPIHDKARARVERTLRRMGIKYHCYKGAAGEHVFFSSRAIKILFEECGRSCRTKHIPRWVFRLHQSHLQNLFEGLIDSDGHVGSGGGLFYHTVSTPLVANMVELAARLGMSTTIGVRNCHACFPDGHAVDSWAYVLTFSRTYRGLHRGKNYGVEKYCGKVWCLRVKDNHNFLIERNGKTMFCGNSDKAIISSPDADVYHATKFLVEKVTLWANSISDSTLYSCVRPANFVESSMNVFQTWHSQLSAGLPLSVTDMDHVRYFMPIRKVAGYTLKALELMKGGEIFVPPATPHRIGELMQRLGVPYVVTGARKGDRATETLMTELEMKRAEKIDGMWVLRS